MMLKFSFKKRKQFKKRGNGFKNERETPRQQIITLKDSKISEN